MNNDLGSAVEMFEAMLIDLDDLTAKLQPSEIDDFAGALDARSILNTAALGLSAVRERLDNVLGEAMGDYRVVVPGHGQVTRHARKSRKAWDKDLYRAVLDSRIADPVSGEIKDETPVEKILHVWNLGTPRLTALRERGLDEDEWCTTEVRPGYQLEVKG